MVIGLSALTVATGLTAPESRAGPAEEVDARPAVSRKSQGKSQGRADGGESRATHDGERRPHDHGVASWYGKRFEGRRTACGERYDPAELTAAHRTLPCGTRLRVSHDGRSVEVTITDRGPFIKGRLLDLSRAAFAELAPPGEGLVRVRIVRMS